MDSAVTMQLTLERDDHYGMYEYACHEGNHALPNILSGARATERDNVNATARPLRCARYAAFDPEQKRAQSRASSVSRNAAPAAPNT